LNLLSFQQFSPQNRTLLTPLQSPVSETAGGSFTCYSSPYNTRLFNNLFKRL